MLTCDVTEARGLVLISGLVPPGQLTVQRRAGTSPTWFTLRGGSNMTITALDGSGFTLEDSEAPIGVPLTYRALSTPTNRIAARNLVNTPKFTAGAQTWTTSAGRTLTTPGGIGHVTSNTSGPAQGIPGRTIAEVAVSQLAASTKYLVSGQIKFTTPAVWTWTDVKANGTWQQLKDAKASWSLVRSSETDPDSITDYTSIFVSLAAGTTIYVAEVQALKVDINQSGQWLNFSAFITTPSSIPSGARLRILHGTGTRSYANSWDLDKFSIFSDTDAAKPYRLEWFSGDTAVPDRPQDYLMQNMEWEDYSHDAFMSWEGAAVNSASRFTAPSRIYTLGHCQINSPSGLGLCEPVLLSDPVASALSQWFGLSAIDTLSRAARSSIFAPLGRDFYVSSSSVRGSASGSLELFTNTLAERSQALTVFASGRVLLLRNPDPAYPETNWYISVGDVDESRTLPDARRPERTWTVPFVTVERPTGLIDASTGVTWRAIKDADLTWQNVRDNNENWLKVLTDAPV